jgi:lipopolysaccharide transport system ATP-binding protein
MDRVVVTSASKRYQPYPRRLADLLRLATRGGWSTRPETWALRDLSFSVGEGESVGIIGMNGAGKSTLLRLLTGTTIATEGRVAVHGRVAALLELGLGMYGDFTGTQNATLACELMGLDTKTIRERLPWMRSFAELGDDMDHPVRSYSAGMQLRLAFSAATAVRPDVLLVDEVLAVGDAYFQHKCVERIRAFQQAGTTLILVTHDLAAVRALCARTLLLDHGRILHDGATAAVVDYYNALVAAKTQAFDISQSSEGGAGRTSTRSGNKEAEILSVELTDAAALPQRSFRVGARARLALRIRIHRSMETPTVGFLIRDRLGVDVFGTNTARLQISAPDCSGGDEIIVCFALTLNIGHGSYAVTVALHHGTTHLDASLDWWDHALTFDVSGDDAPFVGLAALPVQATITAAEESPARGPARAAV